LGTRVAVSLRLAKRDPFVHPRWLLLSRNCPYLQTTSSDGGPFLGLFPFLSIAGALVACISINAADLGTDTFLRFLATVVSQPELMILTTLKRPRQNADDPGQRWWMG
jgi:hypothetical protein